MISTPGACIIKLIMTVIYGFPWQARVKKSFIVQAPGPNVMNILQS
jgi:hypothetical protein